MTLAGSLLLSDLLVRRVRCEEGVDCGAGCWVWMHPPVHRVLGWASRPSQFGQQRWVWRLDQLRGMTPQEAFVRGDGSETDAETLERLPTLLQARVVGATGASIGAIADCSVRMADGHIIDYLVSRSDPRLPGSSRWRLDPRRITDQQPGLVLTALEGLNDLPLMRASVREELLRRSRRWRDRLDVETGWMRDQMQEIGQRAGGRLEGWLEEEEPRDDQPPPHPVSERDVWDDWEDEDPPQPRRREQGDPWR